MFSINMNYIPDFTPKPIHHHRRGVKTNSRFKKSKRYDSTEENASIRRQRQIENGSLKYANGLVTPELEEHIYKTNNVYMEQPIQHEAAQPDAIAKS